MQASYIGLSSALVLKQLTTNWSYRGISLTVCKGFAVKGTFSAGYLHTSAGDSHVCAGYALSAAEA